MRRHVSRFLTRCFWIGFETVGAILALAIIAGGILVWRAAQGPVTLDFLTGPLERELSALKPDVSVDVGGTVLTWEGWPETFALRARDVRITTSEGRLVQVPAVDLHLHVPALLAGTVAPTRITARNARIRLTRAADGFRFGLDTDTDAADRRDVAPVLRALLDDLMAAPDPARRLSYLEELRITGARLRLRDEVLAAVWHAPQARVVLRRTATGLRAEASLSLALDGSRVPLSAKLSYARGASDFALRTRFGPVTPKALAQRLPPLAPAAGVTVPISGTAEARIDLAGQVQQATASVQGDAGTLTWPRWVPTPRPVREAGAEVSFNRSAQRLRVSDLRVAFGTDSQAGPVITGQATAAQANGDVTLEAKAAVADMPVADLGDYWPSGIQERGDARGWILENIPDGQVARAEVETALRLADGGLADVTVDHLDGSLRYSGLEVHYLRPLPPVTDVSGTARFDARTFRFNVTKGRLGAVTVPGARLEVTGLHLRDQFLSIDLETEGPLAATLAPLAHPRLDLLSELGLEPAEVAGQARVSAAFGLPLLKDLTFEQMQVQAQAELRQVGIDDLVLDSPIREGDLSLHIDKAGMTVGGPARLDGVPLTFTWTERFGEEVEAPRTVEARVPSLDAAARARLGLDAAPYLDGPVSLNLSLRSDSAGSGRIQGAANLKDATLALSEANWRKPAGVPGQATFDLRLVDDRPQRLAGFRIQAGTAAESGDTGASPPVLDATGEATFEETGRDVRRLRLSRLRLDGTDLTGIEVARQDQGWAVEIAGGQLDLAPLRDRLALGGGAVGNGTAATETAAPGPPLNLRIARLVRLRLDDAGHGLENLQLEATRDASGVWRRVQATAEVPQAHVSERLRKDDAATALGFEIAPLGEDGRRRLLLRADNAGASLRALDAFDGIEGGALKVEGQTREATADSPIDAEIDMGAFQVRDAPLLARLLSVALLTGISEVLRGEGLAFQRLRGEAVFDDGRLSTDLIHAYGPALGITAKGTLDFTRQRADLRGVLVPAAVVNRVLGAIPLIGNLLTGGEGEGLIAVRYRLSGPLADAKVAVNPLSALTPGFLRGVFGLLDRQAPAAEAEPKALPETEGR